MFSFCLRIGNRYFPIWEYGAWLESSSTSLHYHTQSCYRKQPRESYCVSYTVRRTRLVVPMRGYFSIKKKGEGAHRSCRRFGGGQKGKVIWMSRLNVRHCGEGSELASKQWLFPGRRNKEWWWLSSEGPCLIRHGEWPPCAKAQGDLPLSRDQIKQRRKEPMWNLMPFLPPGANKVLESRLDLISEGSEIVCFVLFCLHLAWHWALCPCD